MLLLATLLIICAPGPRDNCVVDGDTFWLAGEKVRIANIDTAEIENYHCASELALGLLVRDRLLVLLNAGPVELLPYERDRDRYRRLLRIVKVNGRDVGTELVREDLARQWDGRRHPWC